jgi:hypothetical protein
MAGSCEDGKNLRFYKRRGISSLAEGISVSQEIRYKKLGDKY